LTHKDFQLYGRAFVDGAFHDGILIRVADGVITDVAETLDPPHSAFRARGWVIVPGFIDLHVHGGDGADFTDAKEKAVKQILAFHARHGSTAVAATTLSASPRDLNDAVQTIVRVAAERPSGAEIVGIHLEGPYISDQRAGAQSRAAIRPADIDEMESLLALAPRLNFMATVAPELPGVRALIEHFRGRVRFSIGHTNADHAAAVAALEWGACHFTHLFNAMPGLHHRDPGVVGAALTSATATAEVIADGIHVHPAALRVAVSAMPRRIALITDAMRACGLGDGTYSLYAHEVTVSDGAARLSDGTLAGSVLTMAGAVRNMIELAGLPAEIVIPMATEIPARIIGAADRKGKIEQRYDADLVMLNERFEIERVWARGNAVGNA
jgi:N-acetylglucosamine-6-phosphate deacetylase